MLVITVRHLGDPNVLQTRCVFTLVGAADRFLSRLDKIGCALISIEATPEMLPAEIARDMNEVRRACALVDQTEELFL